MKTDKFYICECGKKIRIHWTNLAEFKRGEDSFCAGASKCKKCNILQSHYLGNIKDINEYISILESLY
jgi:hypothetical protein